MLRTGGKHETYTVCLVKHVQKSHQFAYKNISHDHTQSAPLKAFIPAAPSLAARGQCAARDTTDRRHARANLSAMRLQRCTGALLSKR
jgi:hypothetical protein